MLPLADSSSLLRPRRTTAVESLAAPAESFDAFIAAVTADGREHAVWSQRVAEELQRRFGAVRVVFAICDAGDAFTVRATTGGGTWDGRTELARAAAEVWRELLPTTAVALHSTANGPLRQAARLAQTTAAAALRFGDDTAIAGAILFGPAETLDSVRLRAEWMSHAAVLGRAVRLWAAAERGLQASWTKRVRNFVRSRPGRTSLIAALSAAAMLAIPTPHYTAADAVVEPLTRRFINAPFEGTLLHASAESGDVVTAGQELARLDENQLRTDRSAAEGARQEAKRRHAAALALRQGGNSQAAEHELEQAEFRLASIDRRLEQAVLRSPIDGVVVRGDLRRAEGTTVTIGQTLFEIAPPGSAIAEVAVPEEEIACVRENLPVTIRFDAFPARSWSGVVERIHPRAELIDGKNVFIADVRLDEVDSLRPGMRGAASIAGDWRPLGWNLVRRPWLSFRRWTGW